MDQSRNVLKTRVNTDFKELNMSKDKIEKFFEIAAIVALAIFSWQETRKESDNVKK